MATTPTAGSQTLSRGLRALEVLAEARAPLSITDLSEALGIHRSNTYRLLRTLEEHRFAIRDDAGLIRLGPRIASLAHGVAPQLTTAAAPALTELAHDLGMTAFLTVLDAGDVVTLASVEPGNVDASIARNPGVRHPLDRGAPGHAIESVLSPAERSAASGTVAPSAAAVAASTLGYALSESEVIDGVTSLAVPLRIPGEPPAAIAVVHFRVPDALSEVSARLQRAAREVLANYS
ncbi:IclR family transcriptional regulator [Leucobacter komagatae]|uniref:IclR family transcriptional regulator n=1 Tax=Leucobacter komagatae TaxID=55969 RepID=A0A0D0H7L1_9MICO|nr:helix-turn-helix domain-containing protein [Leucobacter komagatae]KIP53190.1 IclR family transcriptional regulator [Leucobacter komagatae]